MQKAYKLNSIKYNKTNIKENHEGVTNVISINELWSI